MNIMTEYEKIMKILKNNSIKIKIMNLIKSKDNDNMEKIYRQKYGMPQELECHSCTVAMIIFYSPFVYRRMFMGMHESSFLPVL